ncbi:hypothetical protein MRB53_003656 [Persea americana]|uniref:Uncharacterized protein n=1 Tax=Persea americana TaxID=3435 RepID=A0ACC2MY94_PERAE|nr:hypothetical protein MRB53_003656 [Persea americana]
MVFVSRRFRRVEKRPALFITGKALTPYEIASCIDDGEDFQRWGADGNGHVVRPTVGLHYGGHAFGSGRRSRGNEIVDARIRSKNGSRHMIKEAFGAVVKW